VLPAGSIFFDVFFPKGVKNAFFSALTHWREGPLSTSSTEMGECNHHDRAVVIAQGRGGKASGQFTDGAEDHAVSPAYQYRVRDEERAFADIGGIAG